jgi:hypothetical protein
LPGLLRGLEVEAFDQPLLVIAVAEFSQGRLEFIEALKVTDPE